MDLKTELRTYGFATVDYPKGVTEIVGEAMESWKKFCSLPLKAKSEFVYEQNYVESTAFGSGYEFKNEPGRTKDRKENFHVVLDDISRLGHIAENLKIETSFIAHSKSLLENLIDPVLDFTEKFEKEFNLSGLRDELYESRGTWILRYLHYFPTGKTDEIIAAHHCDKAGLTMYLSETTPGVEYYSNDKKWMTMPVLSGKTIITPDMQIQYKTKGELKALYYRVVANDVSAKEGRYSIVCFADFRKSPRYHKEKQGRLQDKPLAFNYGMPFEEFSKLF